MKYVIIYDYEDSKNCQEKFEGGLVRIKKIYQNNEGARLL